MEDETGLMKVNAETMTVAAHLRENFQLQSEGTGWLRPQTSEFCGYEGWHGKSRTSWDSQDHQGPPSSRPRHHLLRTRFHGHRSTPSRPSSSVVARDPRLCREVKRLLDW